MIFIKFLFVKFAVLMCRIAMIKFTDSVVSTSVQLADKTKTDLASALKSRLVYIYICIHYWASNQSLPENGLIHMGTVECSNDHKSLLPQSLNITSKCDPTRYATECWRQIYQTQQLRHFCFPRILRILADLSSAMVLTISIISWKSKSPSLFLVSSEMFLSWQLGLIWISPSWSVIFQYSGKF